MLLPFPGPTGSRLRTCPIPSLPFICTEWYDNHVNSMIPSGMIVDLLSPMQWNTIIRDWFYVYYMMYVRTTAAIFQMIYSDAFSLMKRFVFWLDSLWPSDALWRKRSGSTLAHVMACCLTTPSHYLNQCWLIISKVQWHLLIIGFIKISLGTMR